MRKSDREPICGFLLEYVSGDGTEAERRAFERHLPGCPACAEETAELTEAWEGLSADMERVEPPKDLKKQVLDAAFASEPPTSEPSAFERPSSRRWLRYGFAAAASVVIAVMGLRNYELQSDRSAMPLPLEEAASASAASIERLVPLYASSEAERAYGVACVVDNGRDKQFIVYVFGAERTEGEEAYQVWLLKDGERSSAGTFRVNEDGIGVLAMPIATEPPAFDAIGITIEPDDRGDQPRGERAFAS
ncbi:anti-sigma factor domain-containing protein [Paenibacillus sp.]|uniref:anti-sigma factor n=1 Tax=Paenibacillus sp. TaxID=58172 RepID=UPI002811A3B2|nr:anti-sigma factor [Paenibacillus sp.]